jgi:hypothetical protein
MRLYFWGAIVSAIFVCNIALAQSPPFSTITISGQAKDIFNKVSLFEKGSSKTPFKTEYISSYDGEYSIDVDIPDDMRKKGNYFYTDMRFWKDKNDNGRKDPGEPISQCHFIIWVPSYDKIFFQVYKGPKYEIDSSNFKYDYKD